MLDLHEAMRGLRFAPEALAVLDANRQVRVISRQAERLFGVPAVDMVGRTTSHLWAEESRSAFMLALNEAAQRIGHADTATPVIRRLKTTKTVLDMCVSAWHPTDDPMYATSKSPTNTLMAPRTIMIHECFYTISLRDVGPSRNPRRGRKLETKSHLEPPTLYPVDEGVDVSPSLSPLTNGSDQHSGRTTPLLSIPPPPMGDTQNVIPSEEFHASLRPQGPYTVAPLSNGSGSLPRRPSPCPSFSRSSPSPPPIALTETLRDGVIDALNTAVITLSSDGALAVRNQQWVDLVGGGEAGVVLLSDLNGKRTSSPSSLHSSPDPNATRQWHPSLVLTDLGFTRPMESTSHPLYRAAILGQVVNDLRCGGVRIDEGTSYTPDNVYADGGSTVHPNLSPTQTECSESIASESEPTATLRGLSPPGALRSLPSDSYFPGDVSPLARTNSGPPPTIEDTTRQAENTRQTATVPRGTRLILEISSRPVRDSRGELVGGVMTIRDVTQLEKDRVESVQNESNMQFEQICDCLPQLVWTTRPDGYHTYYNKGWYEYTGADPHDSAGLGWQGLFHPDDMPAAAMAWSHSLRTGEMYETNYRCRRRDGAYRWMVGRALPMRDCQGRIVKWLGTCTDIHDTVEALAVSRRAQERLQATLNHAAVTLWAVDQDMKVTVAEGPGLRQLKLLSSPQGSTTTSSSRSDHSSSQPASSHNSRSAAAHRLRNNSMIGRSIYEAWDASWIGTALERAFAGEMAVQEMEIEGRWFRTQFTPLREEWDGASGQGVGPEAVVAGAVAPDEDRPVIGVVGASMDITDRKIAEARLRESFAERSRLLASETAAKEASRLKSQFLANMSHEIRTPIAGVIGLSELLCDTHLNEEQRGIAENIQRSADALLTVINDILDFSKVEMGKLEIDNIPLSLGVVLLDTKKMLSFATNKKGLIFRDEIQIKYAGRVVGDPGRLRQVLTNLLTNSIKFTSEGSITLRATQESEDNEMVRVRFSVEDEGMGIADSIRQRLFQPFSQADSSTARRYGGTGLGLTISKNLVELMGGHIGLDSKEGRETCAWFSVPFKKASDEVPAAPRSLSPEAAASVTLPVLPKIDSATESNGSGSLVLGPASAISSLAIQNTGLLGSNMLNGMAPRPSGSLQRPREGIWILVAEDNLINQQIALKTLRKMNFNAEAADNGKEVLAALERRTYDLILMDCQMPEMDGYEATKRIRQLESVEVRSVPIIAMTASAIRGDKEKCLRVGMSDYLSKPVKRQALEAMLVRWLYDETYRQELSRWFLPPSQQPLSISPTNTPPLENGTPTSARPGLFQASESTQSASGFSVASEATLKAGSIMKNNAAVKAGLNTNGAL